MVPLLFLQEGGFHISVEVGNARLVLTCSRAAVREMLESTFSGAVVQKQQPEIRAGRLFKRGQIATKGIPARPGPFSEPVFFV